MGDRRQNRTSTEARTQTVVTARGVGLTVFGLSLTGIGVAYGSPPLVFIGVTIIGAVTVAGMWMLLSIHTFLLRFPFARRDVTPRPLTVEVPGRVTVAIESAAAHAGVRHRSRRFTRAIVESLDIREQAASELTGGVGTKATVTRTPQSLTLSYVLQPTRRGRWPLGPALVHSSDPLGMVLSDTSVGETEFIPVWPAIVDLSATAGALMGQADRVVLGARTPSPDDAALRDYREGDDLRRVHWKSSARRGTMLVRSDEQAGRRPATVVMSLPLDSRAIEWTISSAASIAVSVLDAGHPVRLLGGGLRPEATHQDRNTSSALARAAILNLTVDLEAPTSEKTQKHDLLDAGQEAAIGATAGEVIIGVFDPLSTDALKVIAPIAESGRAWAIVRTSEDIQHRKAAHDTTQSLRRAGWRATTATTDDNLENIWTTLLRAGDME